MVTGMRSKTAKSNSGSPGRQTRSRPGTRCLGRGRDHGRHHPRLGDFHRRRLRAPRSASSDHGAAGLGARWIGGGGRCAHLRRVGQHVSGGGRPVSLPQARLRSAVGISVRLGLVTGDSVGRHCLPRGGLRHLSRRLFSVGVHQPHSGCHPDRILGLAAERGPGGRDQRDRRPLDRQLLRSPSGRRCAGGVFGDQGRCPGRTDRVRVAGAGEGDAGVDGAAAVGPPDGRDRPRDGSGPRQL